jgi:hypothetical protein
MLKKLFVLLIPVFILASCGADKENIETENGTGAVEIESSISSEDINSSNEIEKKLKLIEEAKNKLEENLLGDEPTSFLKGLFITQVNAADEEDTVTTDETSLTEEELADIEEELE